MQTSSLPLQFYKSFCSQQWQSEACIYCISLLWHHDQISGILSANYQPRESLWQCANSALLPTKALAAELLKWSHQKQIFLFFSFIQLTIAKFEPTTIYKPRIFKHVLMSYLNKKLRTLHICFDLPQWNFATLLELPEPVGKFQTGRSRIFPGIPMNNGVADFIT